jgi:hypothetical protein
MVTINRNGNILYGSTYAYMRPPFVSLLSASKAAVCALQKMRRVRPLEYHKWLSPQIIME